MSVVGILILTFGLTLRAILSRHPYSGQGKPPMFGDFEAQRHWQEITVNLPISEWYFNTTSNDLLYWGLDYPPLTAYHSYLMGKVAEYLDPSYVALNSSCGIEDVNHKIFMRGTVLLADLLIYIPSVQSFSRAAHRADEIKSSKSTAILMTYPGLILIDHGHFQYNGISLGLMILAVAALMIDRDCLSSVLFMLAISYKQMELYHALPFFFYLLGKCTFKQPSWKSSIVKLIQIGSTVILTFVFVWLPFLTSLDQISQVIHRVFPLARGVFEDKVANVWCAFNVAIKIKDLYDVQTLAMGCLASTALASLPTNILLFMQPSKANLILALINTSLAFFLFSFQVHEKSILLVGIPVALLLGGFKEVHHRFTPLISVWLLTVTTASMFPLLQKDELAIPALALSVMFIVMCHFFDFFEPVRQVLQGSSQKGSRPSPKPLDKNEVSTWKDWFTWTMFNFSMTGFIILCVASVHVTPPPKFPHLWPLLISIFSAVHFVIFAIYFNLLQIKVFRAVRQLEAGIAKSKKQH